MIKPTPSQLLDLHALSMAVNRTIDKAIDKKTSSIEEYRAALALAQLAMNFMGRAYHPGDPDHENLGDEQVKLSEELMAAYQKVMDDVTPIAKEAIGVHAGLTSDEEAKEFMDRIMPDPGTTTSVDEVLLMLRGAVGAYMAKAML